MYAGTLKIAEHSVNVGEGVVDETSLNIALRRLFALEPGR